MTEIRQLLLRAKDLRRGFKHLSLELDVSRQFISNVMAGRSKMPKDKCIMIENLTNGEVRCEQLRPDINWEELRRKHA